MALRKIPWTSLIHKQTQEPKVLNSAGASARAEERSGLSEALEMIVDDEESMDVWNFPTFRNASGIFSFTTSCVRSLGKFKCGKKFCASTGMDVEKAPNVVLPVSSSTTSNTDSTNSHFAKLSAQSLHQGSKCLYAAWSYVLDIIGFVTAYLYAGMPSAFTLYCSYGGRTFEIVRDRRRREATIATPARAPH